MSAYSVELKTNNLSDFQVFPDENDFMKIKITTSNKLIYAIKRSFEPYNKVYIPENLEYGRINHSYTEIELKCYNPNTEKTNCYYVTSENNDKINDIIQSIKDMGYVMTEGRVEEGYGNEYLGENKVLGKYIYEKYERK